jgi:hypothetical protein
MFNTQSAQREPQAIRESILKNQEATTEQKNAASPFVLNLEQTKAARNEDEQADAKAFNADRLRHLGRSD